MFHRIHQQLGTAGFIIAIVALVAALGGGAYAASGGLTGKQKKEVKSIAKAEAKKVVPATGPAGPAGAPGAKGDAGAPGSNGTNGADGASPAGTPFTGSKTVGSVTCTEGGVEYKGANTALVCNGKKGVNGTTGFTETLPAEKTETGTWAAGVTPAGTTLPLKVPISFPIPLISGLSASQVHYVKADETAPAGCAGGTAVAPTAEPGNLCVYEAFTSFLAFEDIFDPTTSLETPGAGATGAIIRFAGEEEAQAWGTWAVTAEVE